MSDLTSLSKLSTRGRGWPSRTQAPGMGGNTKVTAKHLGQRIGGGYGA